MNYASFDDVKNIVTGMAKKIPHGVMIGNTTVGHIEWQMYLMRDYLKLDGTPLANASNDYDELLEFAQNNSLITADTTDKSLFKYDSTNDVLTLPDYIGLCLQGGNSVEEKEAGLPNIEAKNDDLNNYYWCQITGNIASPISFGAIQFDIIDNNYIIQTSVSAGNTLASGLSFDASRSSSIYGNSTTVQPPAIQLIPQIKYKKETVYEGIDLNKLLPTGSVISFMGTIAPEYYLVCDGTVYNINNYTILANFFEEQFGIVNYFGGDGTTTFAVPDLRGEFLRGTGTNSHTNQGSGANVGVHQDGTEIPFSASYYKSNLLTYEGTSETVPVNYDSVTRTAIGYTSHGENGSGSTSGNALVTTRPTNTSVLYCIKYK